MATIITHPLMPIVVAYVIGREKISTRLLIAASIASIIPDIDVISFKFGVPYGDQFGHRGFSHSLFIAMIIGLVSLLFKPYFNCTKKHIFALMFLGTASHGFLDALTNGGSGIAFFWPFTSERYFFPITPIEVSPIGLSNFLTARGASVLWSELWLI
ncbi:MAG: metal-dependent hydrolase [Kordiimonadaceae bacterium]|jgi:inner membrane protein|nr:metal-dependent hydrolase [Kordiimonadaceae bacterium]MBT6033770.1 metal-dependent hydrolase [Kordiimonadaceae bacterium]